MQQIGDERDNARLRHVLMNDGTLMLLGAATTFFREARAYDQPLYNFFRIFNLEAEVTEPQLGRWIADESAPPPEPERLKREPRCPSGLADLT